MLCMVGFNDPKKFPKTADDLLKTDQTPKAMNPEQWKAMISMILKDAEPEGNA